jgi:DNA-binding NarL/FixJ family response regulator
VIRVLLVDDHRMVLDGFEAALAPAGDIAVVGAVSSGADAQDAARRLAPDVVLIDFGLPDVDGAAAAAEIRRHRPETKVVMVTGLVDEAVVLRAVEAGCSGYITKHQPVEQLVGAVRAAAAGEALISPAMLSKLLPRLQRTHRRLGSDLTSREREVLQLLAEGLSNQAIAADLYVSVNTVRSHVQNVLTKLGAHSKLEAAAIAAREGLVELARRPPERADG